MIRSDDVRPTFASASLARRIEVAEASLTAEVGTVQRRRGSDVLVADIGGGVGVFSGGSPFDKVIGLGFETLEPVDLERFECLVAARGGHVQVELSTLADPELAAGLTARGYTLCGFENVLGCSLEHVIATDDSIIVSSPHDSATWIATVARASAEPDRFDGPASHESFSDETIAAVLRDMECLDGFHRFVAKIENDDVGGASMRIHAGIAQLTGAATLRAFRRRGVQGALLRSRLAVAARAGCDLAVVTTQPGSLSQHNVMRVGFSLLYSRAILRRSPSADSSTRRCHERRRCAPPSAPHRSIKH